MYPTLTSTITAPQTGPLPGYRPGSSALTELGRANAPDFQRLLWLRDTATDRVQAPSPQRLRQAAQQLVATTLIQPMLAQARQDPFKSELFHGGQGEEMFAAQLDTLLADRIAQRTDFPIVKAIERYLTHAPRTRIAPV